MSNPTADVFDQWARDGKDAGMEEGHSDVVNQVLETMNIRPGDQILDLGCGIGQGLTAGNTTAGIARNPGAAGSMFTSFSLGRVLIESIAIYGLVIAFMLMGKY